MRARQLRDRSALESVESTMDVDLHVQSERGQGTDLGFTFRSFDRLGEPEEELQEQVRFNGVNANIKGEVQLPIVESRTSLAAPVALGLTERYRYLDGGPAAPGQRWIRVEPVSADALLFQGQLKVDDATGRILEERSARSGLPGPQLALCQRREIVDLGQAPRIAAHVGWRLWREATVGLLRRTAVRGGDARGGRLRRGCRRRGCRRRG